MSPSITSAPHHKATSQFGRTNSLSSRVVWDWSNRMLLVRIVMHWHSCLSKFTECLPGYGLNASLRSAQQYLILKLWFPFMSQTPTEISGRPVNMGRADYQCCITAMWTGDRNFSPWFAKISATSYLLHKHWIHWQSFQIRESHM